MSSHLGHENELVLPADTLWRVVAHRDVVQSNHRNRTWDDHTPTRVHAIQMIEFAANDIPPGTAIVDLTPYVHTDSHPSNA